MEAAILKIYLICEFYINFLKGLHKHSTFTFMICVYYYVNIGLIG